MICGVNHTVVAAAADPRSGQPSNNIPSRWFLAATIGKIPVICGNEHSIFIYVCGAFVSVRVCVCLCVWSGYMGRREEDRRR